MRFLTTHKYSFIITSRILAVGLSLLFALPVSCAVKKPGLLASTGSNVANASLVSPQVEENNGTEEGAEAPNAQSPDSNDMDPFDTILAAAMESDIKALDALASVGADFNITDTNGQTPLMRAIKNFYTIKDLTATAKALVKGGASISVMDKEGKTALDYALWAFDGPGSNGDDNFHLTKALIEADTAKRGKTVNLTPYLFVAISVSAERTASYFIEKGADVNAADGSGMTILMYAANKSMASLTATLIESGANLDRQDKQGMTALMYAVSYMITSPDYYETTQIKKYRSDITMQLIKAGADIKARNNYGQTAYDLLLQAKGLLGTDAHWELKVLMAE